MERNYFLAYINNLWLSKNWVLTVLLISFASFLFAFKFFSKTKLNLPPGPAGLPILGYLPFLRKEPFRKLYHLSKKYGNVISLYMGRTYVVILGDYTAVKDALSKSSTTDKAAEFFNFLPDGVGFSSENGEEWIEQRRYCLRAMKDLGLGKSPWESLVQEEVDDFVKLIAKEKGRPMSICPMLASSVSNNIASFLFGKRLPMDDPTRKFLNESIDVTIQFFSATGLRNYFPGFCDFLVKLGVSKFAAVHKKMVAFNNYIREEVEQHKQSCNRKDMETFIGGYLKEVEKNEQKNFGNSFNDASLRGNVQGIFLGGSDTIRAAIHWLLLAMASFPDIQARVHRELDAVKEEEETVTWPERSKVPYTLAVILEAQRWKTLAPLNSPRIVREDIKICGYDVPRGTTIIANYWALHNDPKYWKNPEKFDPERFLTEDGKQVIPKKESYVPFSFGKRNCPGESIAMIEIFSYFVAIMRSFTVLPLEGEKPKMEAHPGLTYQPVDQMLRFLPRE